MTRKLNFKKLRTVFATMLTLLFTVCSCLFCLSACGGYTPNDPNYSWTEDTTVDTDELIVNSLFTYGVENKNISEFPVLNPAGWNQNVHNKAANSAVASGVVNVTSDNWTTQLTKLINDVDFLDYLNNKVDVKQKTVDAILATNPESTVTVNNVTVAQVIDYVKANVESVFANPGKHNGENVDDFVYMINNYGANADYKFGTAQELNSSSNVSMEKGKTYAISVWVKTYNVTGNNPAGYGANIRINNVFNGASQAVYAIDNVIANDWTKYTVYVTADKDYDCSLSISLGLGYGNGSANLGKDYVEGTVYFDDITIEELDASPVSSADNLVYGADKITPTEISDNVYAYDMSLYTPSEYVDYIAFPTNTNHAFYDSFDFTKSNVSGMTSKDIASNSSATFTPSADGKSITFNLTRASYAFTFDGVELGSEEYAYVAFYIDNQLDGFGSTDVTVDVIDILGTTSVKRPAVATFSDFGEKTLCELIIKNNFSEKNFTSTRNFSVQVVIGPTDIPAVKYASELATGSVTISDLKFATGKTYEFVRNADFEDTTDKTANYDYYQLFTKAADASVALYSGYAADYTEKDEVGSTYSLTVAPGNIGDIVTLPTNVKGYNGITTNHVYTSEITPENKDTLSTLTNTRAGKGDASGIAGLINTKYLDAYKDNTGLDIAPALNGAYTKDIQPLMIYNADGSSYGFIGSSSTISAGEKAKVAVKLRVVDKSATEKATAYVYVVDTQTKNNDVMTFADFTKDGTEYKGADRKLALKVDSSMMKNGWATVEFYIGNGNTAKDYRVEIWNGSRDGEVASYGYVFIDFITSTSKSGFVEQPSESDAFSSSGNPLYNQTLEAFEGENDELISYKRPLTATEEAFNVEYPDKAVSYTSKYIWAKNSTFIYAIYDSIEVDVINPYDTLVEDNDDEHEHEHDSSTFWLGLSSLILAGVIVLALVALIVKNVKSRKAANKSDAKINYQVKSRISTHKENVKIKAKKEKAVNEVVEDEEPTVEEPETTEETQETAEETLDEYVYGEVTSFGDVETNEETETPAEETQETPAENAEETKAENSDNQN